MVQLQVVLRDGSVDVTIDTLASDMTTVEQSASMQEATSTTVVASGANQADDGSSTRVVAGVGLAGVGAVVATTWWLRTVRANRTD